MTSEYNEKYAEMKKEKKKVVKEYEDAFNGYMKLKNEYEALQKNLDTSLKDY
eukprot:CAMPEP_0114580074 /NCGR_PEP_ID=MMETSP0125-20121206/4406_1 /TAXON_ID=485358 ORGANISM="Aristerostoma sp., Strain ATCC 50986" /NCGR_SAMPLE_ID=MMETSP0125 /ASSEMBLY_ACC=CAM_ASM_000245 /LENGTH=51 /DNA_ID=CAMNT_0001771365 /DNA_START=935 /DNA_END=1090 /DNA_ORIENTATION=+